MKPISVVILAAALGTSSLANATPRARAAVMRFLAAEGEPTQGVRVRTTKRFAKGTEQVTVSRKDGKARLLSVSGRGQVSERVIPTRTTHARVTIGQAIPINRASRPTPSKM